MEQHELYELHCRPALEAIQKDVEELVRMLKGSDGADGLLTRFAMVTDRVARLEAMHKKVLAGVAFLVSPVWIRIVAWAFEKLTAA